MGSKRSQEGYLVIDHRNSPGVPQSVVGHTGKVSPAVPGGQLYESATVTCAHCQAIVILNPKRTRPRNYCAKCDDYVCDNPICVKECSPFARVIERTIERAIKGIRGILMP